MLGFFALVWGLGSLLVTLRRTVGWCRLRRLTRQAYIPPAHWHATQLEGGRQALGLAQLPVILLCRRTQVPMVIGLFHPRVILPEALAAEMSDIELTETLIHECAHIRRGDPWLLAAQHLELIMFWPHPLLHYLNRELERAREELCDNYVLAASRPAAYAETLLRLAQACLPAPRGGVSMAMFRHGTDLEHRIQRLVDKRRERNVILARWPRYGVVLAIILLAAGISSVQVRLGSAQDLAAPVSAVNSARADEKSPSDKPAITEPADEIARKVGELTRDWNRIRIFDDAEIWAAQIRELVLIGEPAVPSLTSLLDQTESDVTLRLLGFTLRAIEDPRAMPALIRAIPKTLRPAGSDCGVIIHNRNLSGFLSQFHMGGPKQRDYVDLSRPVREICTAIQKISGTHFDEEEIYLTFLDGDSHQRDIQRQLYDRVARQWAGWWETNWNRFVEDPKLAAVRLPPVALSGQPGLGSFPNGPKVKVKGGNSNVILSPIEKHGGYCLLDLDTGRHVGWSQALRGLKGQEVTPEALKSWSSQQGMDLMGMTYVSPESGETYYYPKGIGLQAWEIPNERWDTIEQEVSQNRPLELGWPAGDILMHYDSEQVRHIPNRRATFLFITRERTPGILRLSTQIIEPGSRPAAMTDSPSNLPIAFNKRYGIPRSNKDLGADQDEEEARKGQLIGLTLEYKFFIQDTGDDNLKIIQDK